MLIFIYFLIYKGTRALKNCAVTRAVTKNFLKTPKNAYVAASTIRIVRHTKVKTNEVLIRQMQAGQQPEARAQYVTMDPAGRRIIAEG